MGFLPLGLDGSPLYPFPVVPVKIKDYVGSNWTRPPSDATGGWETAVMHVNSEPWPGKMCKCDIRSATTTTNNTWLAENLSYSYKAFFVFIEHASQSRLDSSFSKTMYPISKSPMSDRQNQMSSHIPRSSPLVVKCLRRQAGSRAYMVWFGYVAYTSIVRTTVNRWRGDRKD